MQMKLPGVATRRALGWAAAGVIALGGLAVAIRVPATDASALLNCDTNSAAMSDIEARVLELMNAERASNGVAPLKVSAALNRAAAWKSGDPSALPPNFSHTDSLGRTPVQQPPGNRAMDCGYATWAAENIAFGFDAEGVVDAWMNSPGHRANILNASYKVAGVGLVGPAWTVNFGVIDDSGTSAPPTVPGGSNPTATATATKTSPAPTATATKTVAPSPTATPTQALPQFQQDLAAGFNLVTYAGGTRSSASAFGSMGQGFTAAYRWDSGQGTWLKYVPGAPSYVSTLSILHNGDVLFIEADSSLSWAY